MISWVNVAKATAAVALVGATTLALEAAYLVHSIPHLPTPRGSTFGRVESPLSISLSQNNSHPSIHYRLLIVGDSLVEGIGCDDTNDALPHQIASHLQEAISEKFPDRPVRVDYWSAGKSGYTAKSCALYLIPSIPLEFLRTGRILVGRKNPRYQQEKKLRADVRPIIILVIGMNHILNWHNQHQIEEEIELLVNGSRKRWEEAYLDSNNTEEIEEKINTSTIPIFLLGAPPLDRFPLPWPLKSLLGWKSEQVSQCVRDLCSKLSNTYYVPLDSIVPPSSSSSSSPSPSLSPSLLAAQSLLYPDMFAKDGFHPSPLGTYMISNVTVEKIINVEREREGLN